MKARSKVRLAGLLLALFVLTTVAAQGAGGEVVRVGNLVVTIDGGVSPTKLPKRTPAPVTLGLKGSIATADGSHVPALKTVHLQFDRHGHLYTKGLPTCRPGQLQATLTAQAKKVCGKALIGTGRAEAEIAFPDQAPFTAGGPMLVFNGAPEHGKQVLIIHVYAFVPAPTTFVTTAVIGHSKGRYGTTADVKVPTIVSGQGSLTSFRVRLHKTWLYKGSRRSLLLASCPSGHLYARGDFDFADNTRLSGHVVQGCNPSQ